MKHNGVSNTPSPMKKQQLPTGQLTHREREREREINRGDVTESSEEDLLVLGLVFAPDEGALHSDDAHHEAQHSDYQSRHQQPTHDLDMVWGSQHKAKHGLDLTRELSVMIEKQGLVS